MVGGVHSVFLMLHLSWVKSLISEYVSGSSNMLDFPSPLWVGWKIVFSSKCGCELWRRLKSLPVKCWLMLSVSGPSDCGAIKDASWRVCWPVTSVLRVPNCLSLSCSEVLFPVGGSILDCTLCLVVQEDFCVAPFGRGFYRLDLPAYLLWKFIF